MDPEPSDAPAGAAADPPIARAETVAVGTELLLGEIQDTNGAWLAAALAERGVDVYWSLRVGDNEARVRDALDAALARSELVITSGGLGPTEDDLTREAIARLLGEAPVVDPRAEAELRARFARLGRPMPERNLKQAWRIPSAEFLANPHGTAPGWLVRTARHGAPRWIAALPGPPRELVPMAQRELFPRLPLPGARLWTRTLKTIGVGESEIADRLGALATRANPSVATYARADGVHVRVAAKGPDADAARLAGEPVAAEVATRLGEAVWGRDDDRLEALVVAALRERGARLAVVEGATTGGALLARLRSVPGADESVVGAVLAWTTEASNVQGSAAEPGTEADREPGDEAHRAARRARRFFAADAAIAVGALRPEAGGGARVDLVSTGRQGDERFTVRLPSAGADARERVVLRALDLLRRRLRGS